MNNKKAKALRKEAITRYHKDEPITEICDSLNKSRQWLYKWLKREDEVTADSPYRAHNRIPSEIEQAVINTRKKLEATRYAQIGVNAINQQLYKHGIAPLPTSTINRILARAGLQDKKKSRYIPKGKVYPKIEALFANSIHQMDLAGPYYIKGDGRFLSLNVMDIATHRIKINPIRRKDNLSIAEGLIKTWKNIGLPDFLQMDNELTFRGSNRYPHSLGLILRLCLSLGIQLVFIPLGEPWRNGEIESFQNTFEKSFFCSRIFSCYDELCLEAVNFEDFHNEYYIYSCLNGKTPNRVLQEEVLGVRLLLESFQLPKDRIPIEDGYIHFIRFIRSDRKMDIFGEKLTVSKELIYEYVKATICTEAQILQIRLGDELVETLPYHLSEDT